MQGLARCAELGAAVPDAPVGQALASVDASNKEVHVSPWRRVLDAAPCLERQAPLLLGTPGPPLLGQFVHGLSTSGTGRVGLLTTAPFLEKNPSGFVGQPPE